MKTNGSRKPKHKILPNVANVLPRKPNCIPKKRKRGKIKTPGKTGKDGKPEAEAANKEKGNASGEEEDEKEDKG